MYQIEKVLQTSLSFSLSVTYVFICEVLSSCQGGTFIAKSLFPPGELLNVAQEIKRNAKLLPNVVSDFITSDTGLILVQAKEWDFNMQKQPTLTQQRNRTTLDS